MSGGALTGYVYDLHRLENWARNVSEVNPVLANMLVDLREVLTVYDKVLSGDFGEAEGNVAWASFKNRWMAEGLTLGEYEHLLEKLADIKSYMDRFVRKD